MHVKIENKAKNIPFVDSGSFFSMLASGMKSTRYISVQFLPVIQNPPEDLSNAIPFKTSFLLLPWS